MPVTPPEELRAILTGLGRIEAAGDELADEHAAYVWELSARAWACMRDSLPAYLDLAEDMRRLASKEALAGSALDLEHSSREAIVGELLARGRFAEAALASVEGK